MNLRLAALLVLTAGCQDAPTLSGQVVDIWGNPIPDATVVLEGSPSRPQTDAYGNFSLPWAEGALKLKAGREGYIQEHLAIEVAAGKSVNPVIALYPKPEENGFYVVGLGDYSHLQREHIQHYGNELLAITGLKSVQTRVESDPFRVVYHTDLRMDEIHRIDLELHALDYRKTTEAKTAVGTEQVDLELWVSKGVVPFEINPMRSRNDYLITADLEPGYYAFTTQKLLSPATVAAFETVPQGVRVAFPFEYR